MGEKNTFSANSQVICRSRNSAQILLQIHVGVERLGRKEEPDTRRSGQGNTRGEEHAKVLFGRSGQDNRSPPESDICKWRSVSPHELYFEKKLNLAHLRVFDNIAYVHVPKEERRKLDPKAEKCILVGYSDEQKGYKCYNPRTKQVRVRRDIVFDESTSWYWPSSPTLDNSFPIFEDEVSEAKMPPDEEEIGALEESQISFQLSGPNVRLSRNDQLDEEPESNGDSIV